MEKHGGREVDETKEREREASVSAVWRHRAFALAGAALGPLSMVFALPALTEDWYVRDNPDGSRTTRSDPTLVVVGGSFALALNAIGSLLCVVRLHSKTPRRYIVLGGTCFLLSTLISLLNVSIFAGLRNREPADGFRYALSYWVTVCLVCCDAVITVCLAVEWTRKGVLKVLSEKERILVLSYTIFLTVISFGTLINKFLILETYPTTTIPQPQRTTFVDTLYFTVQTVITTGFGDIVPQSFGARLFAYFNNTLGIVCFGICFVVALRESVIEYLEESYKEREKRMLSRFARRKRIPFSCLAEKVEEALEEETDFEKKERVKKELKRLRRRDFRSKIVISTLFFLLFWAIGSVAYVYLEKWSYWDSIWFSYVAFTTVGYGDLFPTTQAGKAFFVAWSFFGAADVTIFFSVLQEAFSSKFKHAFADGDHLLEDVDHEYARKIGIEKPVHLAETSKRRPSEKRSEAPSKEKDQNGGDDFRAKFEEAKRAMEELMRDEKGPKDEERKALKQYLESVLSRLRYASVEGK
ncbi:hypothetical protein BT69DRAFT_1277007 [Atractiella rhizophila]|nr:hypothetical protein BT69DRAFT_1277007 [Atractiella rhizophila]